MTMTTIKLLSRRLWSNVWSLAAGSTVALAVLAGGVSPVPAQSIACMLGGEPITGLDIEQRTKLNFLTTRKQMPRQEILDELINEKVKIKEAKRFGVDPSASDIDQAYTGMSQRMRLSPEQLTKSLESQGVRPETLKSRLKAEMVTKTSADIPGPLRELLDKTPIGHLTPPEITKQGVEMVALCDRKPTKIDTPKKREIREKMFAQKYEAKSKAYLNDIRKAAMIECR